MPGERSTLATMAKADARKNTSKFRSEALAASVDRLLRGEGLGVAQAFAFFGGSRPYGPHSRRLAVRRLRYVGASDIGTSPFSREQSSSGS